VVKNQFKKFKELKPIMKIIKSKYKKCVLVV